MIKNAAEKKLLIANRGEIAIRIARSAKQLGFKTVAVYSDADRDSEHVRACDESVYIGASAPGESYLRGEKIIAAAKQTGAKFIHPGYGFLSERAHFAELCIKEKITFVGPSAESMTLMGDKIQARAVMDQLGVPRVPGSAGAVKTAEEAISIAEKIEFPVLLKAAAGGGGKGMRRVDSKGELASALESASREALSAFGDGSMYVEKFIVEPHHVEIQVFGDGKGRGVHLGERECSIQRRHQKVWEETPAPILEIHPETRKKMFECALKIVQHVRYAGAGTLEFIVDGKGAFYFLEMNTRLQVEHPVTEWVTGVDLVEWQLRLAASANSDLGEFALPKIPERKGASIEVRFYAEDPITFLPAPGKLGGVQFSGGPGVRVDTSYTGPGEVSLFYDPMIAKISVWGKDRDQAVSRMRMCLDETRVWAALSADGSQSGSLRTNLPFLQRLCRCEDVIKGNTATDLISKNASLTAPYDTEPSSEVALATAIFSQLRAARHFQNLDTREQWASTVLREQVENFQ